MVFLLALCHVFSEILNHKSMNFEKLVPNIFYIDINDGIKLFVDCLGFTIGHNEIKSAQPSDCLKTKT